jgi:hypothetical protein
LRAVVGALGTGAFARFQTSPALAAVFCAILALHLISVDRLLREQFPRRSSGRAGRRMVLAAGALSGWLLAGGFRKGPSH